MAIPFLAYPKMGTRSEVRLGGEIVVTEKVHGASVCVAVGADSGGVPLARIGKRKSWLEPDEVFFGWQRLRVEMQVAVMGVLEALGASRVRLYGEMCGEGVQTGIFYSRELRVLWFDCLVGDERWLSDSELRACVSPVVPLLMHGGWQDVREHPVRFETRVPGLFGERVDPEQRWAEGWVAKRNPDVRMGGERWIVKRKIPEFDERGEFDQSRPFDSGAAVPFEELLRWGRRMGGHPARGASARSKVGEDERAVADEVVLDVLVDLESTWPSAVGALSAEAMKVLEEAIRGRVS